jgi:hypothetical protein
MKHGDVFLTPGEAYARLGIYAGDDGLTADIDPEFYKDTASNLGLKLTVDVVKRGEPGVSFLARYYSPKVWYGEPDSCCDIQRQLAKFHVTVKLPSDVTPTDKLLEKSRSYYLSDANTPVLGPFVSKVVQLHGKLPEVTVKTSLLRSWMVDTLGHGEADEQYPNAYGEWMVDLLNKQLPMFDHEVFNRWLGTVNTIEKCLLPPTCNPPPPLKESDAKTYVNDDVVIPQPATPSGRVNNKTKNNGLQDKSTSKINWKPRKAPRQKEAPKRSH